MTSLKIAKNLAFKTYNKQFVLVYSNFNWQKSTTTITMVLTQSLTTQPMGRVVKYCASRNSENYNIIKYICP